MHSARASVMFQQSANPWHLQCTARLTSPPCTLAVSSWTWRSRTCPAAATASIAGSGMHDTLTTHCQQDTHHVVSTCWRPEAHGIAAASRYQRHQRQRLNKHLIVSAFAQRHGSASMSTGRQRGNTPASQSSNTHHQQQDTGVRLGDGLQLPSCYTTVLSDQPAGSGDLSSWTADDGLEAADREAIRQAEQARLARHAASRAALPPPPTVITRLPAHFEPEVLDNAMLLLDKPLDWEADETARSLRWALSGTRIGYVSGLEPGTTGLMLLLFNKATSLTGLLQNLGSRYRATIRLGAATDTHDAAGRVTMVAPWQHITDEELQLVAMQLVGRHVQVPPAFTAVKLRGKPIYELTRQTAKEELVPRPVTITHLQLERVEPGSQDVSVEVTFARAGYMRSLAHEIGHRLGCGAHLTACRREAIGGFLVDNAWTLDVLLPVARKFAGKAKKGSKR